MDRVARGCASSWAGRGSLAAGTLLLAAGVGMVAGCERKSGQTAGPPPTPEVMATTVEPVTAPGLYEFIAQTAASRNVEVRARVQGFLLKRHFEEGGKVKEGELLYTIDPRSFEADLQKAKASLAQAKAVLSLAESNLTRVQEGVEKGGLPKAELDKAVAQKDEAAAQVMLADASVTNAGLELSYTKVLSPVTGTVGRSQKQEGSLVDAGANSLLVESQQVDPIYVMFNVSERDVLRWRSDVASGRIKLVSEKNLPTEITLSDGTVFAQQGTINFVDVRVDPTTGTAMIRATFPNPEQRIMPGQFVKIRILGVTRPNVLTVPQESVMSTPSGTFVYVIDKDSKIERRPVELGDWLGSDWIVERGVKPGDRIMVDNLQKVAPGMTVKLATTPAAAATAPASGAKEQEKR
ncbi:MAG: efflux RND transporter periplasmic adaptor subunit [Phycisphaerales bacterium]|nr:efflux RND transporter periplasmic adaptor subunit [Phycisphaerales bacterium]